MKRHKDYLFVTTLTSLDAISDLANSTGVANATVDARITVVGAAARNATAAPASTTDPNMAKNTFIVVVVDSMMSEVRRMSGIRRRWRWRPDGRGR